MLKGRYLKVKNLCPVYNTNSKVYCDPSLYDEVFIKGVNVTVDVDEEVAKLHGPIMARPAMLPCKAYQVLDIEEYTKHIQDEVLKALYEIQYNKMNQEARNLYFKGMTSIDLIASCKGSEFMAMYENYQEGTKKEREELQKEIKEAKKLLEENGYVVGKKE